MSKRSKTKAATGADKKAAAPIVRGAKSQRREGKPGKLNREAFEEALLPLQVELNQLARWVV
jgi:hypothetical protein